MMAFPRSYTDEQVEQVRQLHAQGLNDRQIRQRIGLSNYVTFVIRHDLLGLEKIPLKAVRTDNKLHKHRDEIIRLHSLNYSDADIARMIGAKREWLSTYRRKHLGLPAVDSQQRLNRDAGRRKQEQTLGCGPGEFRWSRLWEYAPSLGWPAGVRKRAAQILELLLEHPEGMTARQLAVGIGLKTKHRIPLRSNDPQGTYTANLIERGLVASAARAINVGVKNAKGRTCQGKNVHLYFLTPAAKSMKAAWLAQRDGHAEPSSQLTEERLS